MTTKYRNKKADERVNHNDDEDDEDDVREYYTSNDKVVRNGVYGTIYPFSNGSTETSQLFKVIDSTGRCDSSGIRLKNRKINKSSNLIYYNSPEEYMRHRKTRNKVDKHTIKSWENRVQEIEEKRDLQENVSEESAEVCVD